MLGWDAMLFVPANALVSSRSGDNDKCHHETMSSTPVKSYLSALRESVNEKLHTLENVFTKIGAPPPHLIEAKPYELLDHADNLLSVEAFTLLQQLRLDMRALDSILLPTRFKLVEQGMLPYKSACLNTAISLDVATTIEELGGSATLTAVAKSCNRGKGANAHKLGRVLRTLAAEFIFVETAQDVFSNTRHSLALTGTGAKSFLGFITDLGMRSAMGIASDLIKEETRNSFAEDTAPFCKVVGQKDGFDRTFAQYMADLDNADMVELSGVGVVGWLNQLTRSSLLNDYPWSELGNATIVDLGAGTGDSGMDVMRKFGGFNWIYQDLPPVIEILKKVTRLRDLGGELTVGRTIRKTSRPRCGMGRFAFKCKTTSNPTLPTPMCGT